MTAGVSIHLVIPLHTGLELNRFLFFSPCLVCFFCDNLLTFYFIPRHKSMKGNLQFKADVIHTSLSHERAENDTNESPSQHSPQACARGTAETPGFRREGGGWRRAYTCQALDPAFSNSNR